MKQTNIQIRGQKSSQFLKKHFYCIPLPLGSKPHKIDHFELRMGQITHSFLAMVIGEIKFTTPLEKKKKRLWRVRYSISSTSCIRFVDE